MKASSRVALFAACMSMSGSGCSLWLTAERGRIDLTAVSATDFTGADDLAAQQSLGWEADSSIYSVAAVGETRWATFAASVGPADHKITSWQGGVATRYAFNNSRSYTLTITPDFGPLVVAVGYAWTELGSIQYAVGPSSRTASYQASGYTLRLGYDFGMTVAVDILFLDAALTETTDTPVVGTRTVGFEPEIETSLVLGFGSEDGLLGFSLIGTESVSIGFGYTFFF